MVEEKTRTKLNQYAVTYHKVRILVPYPRNIRVGICQGCKRQKGKEIKTTQIHHWYYAYEVNTVRKNPLLALDNSNEFCFNPCHKTADAFRALFGEISPKNYSTVIDVAKLMPPFMQKRFTQLARLWLKEVKRK